MDTTAAALGMGSRTTAAGVEIVKDLMAEADAKVIPVALDPRYCHLDMLFNALAERTCVARVDLLPSEGSQRKTS